LIQFIGPIWIMFYFVASVLVLYVMRAWAM